MVLKLLKKLSLDSQNIIKLNHWYLITPMTCQSTHHYYFPLDLQRSSDTRILPIDLERKSPHGSSDEYLKRVTPGVDTMMDHQGKTHLAALFSTLHHQPFDLSQMTAVQFVLKLVGGVTTGLMGLPWGWLGPYGVGGVTMGLAGLPQGWRGCQDEILIGSGWEIGSEAGWQDQWDLDVICTWFGQDLEEKLDEKQDEKMNKIWMRSLGETGSEAGWQMSWLGDVHHLSAARHPLNAWSCIKVLEERVKYYHLP